jgi:mannose-6-phosphate isomerase
MKKIISELQSLDLSPTTSKQSIVESVQLIFESHGYCIVEINAEKPWGAYFRFDDTNTHSLVEDFFSSLLPLGVGGEYGEKLSPKILLVTPNQRLSWQYHNRRGEIWSFVTPGSYHHSRSDAEGVKYRARAGALVQFDVTERHRLVGLDDGYALVAEIWRHTDPLNPSDEDDIVRLHDDYKR